MGERSFDVLVTGGAGYIGSRVVPLVQDDARVDRVVVRDSLSSGSPRALRGHLKGTLVFGAGDVPDLAGRFRSDG